jgi:hypothetical protein
MTPSAFGTFSGTILNSANFGKTSNDLVNLWNSEIPEDHGCILPHGPAYIASKAKAY